MSDEMNFDDIMRQKMSEDDFSFSESNWEKAEAMIIAAEKKKKKKIIFFIFFLGALVGIAFMLPFVFNQKELKGTNTTTSEEKTISSQTNEIMKQEKYNITSKNPELDKLKQEKSTYNQRKDFSVVKNKSSDETKLNYGVKKKEIIGEKEKNSKSSDLTSFNKNDKSPTTFKKKEKTISVSLNYTKEENEKKSTADIDERDNSAISNQSVKNQENVDSSSVLTDSQKDTTQNKADSTIQSKIDSAQVAPIVENKQKEEPKQKKDFISIDIGTNYCFGWKNNTHTEGAGFNVLAGLSYTHYFNQHLSALIGVQYNNLSHLTESYSAANTQYGFGYTKSNTVVTPKTLHYLIIPVKIQYNLNPKNILAVGFTPMFLLNSSSMVDAYTQADFIATTHTTKTKSGYMDGINSMDMQLSIAYRRSFLKRFVLSGELYYGLLDIRYNSYWGNHITENNRGFKLILSYNFIK